jgi:NAD(P)-dependent dehydrogenase (short-subunit alcohol dehydrogenase family)
MSGTCLIVGAGPGIGLACAKLFAAEGYDLALAARRPQKIADAVSELRKTSGRNVQSYAADAGDESSLAALVAQVRSAQGEPAVAIFNAASAQMGRPTTLPAARVMDEFRANVLGGLVLAQQLAPAMKAAGRGTILFTGGGFAYEPSTDYSSLSMAKAALRNLAYTLAQELGGSGIHVGTVTVHGFVQAGTHFDPALIAHSFLKLHRQPKGHFDIEAIYK